MARTPNAWVEISAFDHGHGGAGWELGSCLWIPARAIGNSDRYRIIKTLMPNDRVFHLIKDEAGRKLVGYSVVRLPAIEVTTQPPEPGHWGGRAIYYRVELENFVRLSEPPRLIEIETAHFEEIRGDILPHRPAYHPYATYGEGIRLTQGLYLGHLTNKMLEIFELYTGTPPSSLANNASNAYDTGQYAEGAQLRKERTFFARNPALRRDAIAKWGYTCSVCDLDFEATYGDIGKGYVEIHHLESIAIKSKENPSAEWSTSINDVRPLCANCHRMAHRRNPPVSIDELKSIMKARALKK